MCTQQIKPSGFPRVFVAVDYKYDVCIHGVYDLHLVNGLKHLMQTLDGFDMQIYDLIAGNPLLFDFSRICKNHKLSVIECSHFCKDKYTDMFDKYRTKHLPDHYCNFQALPYICLLSHLMTHNGIV